MVDVDRVLVLLGELEKLLARLGEACDEVSLGLLARLHMDAAAHAHDGVEGGAHGARKGAAAVDDVGMPQAAGAAEELHTRSLVLDKVGRFVGVPDPELVKHIVPGVVAAGTVEEERLVLGIVLRGYLHGVEDAVTLVFGGGGEDHFAVGGNLQVDVVGRIVGERVAAYLGRAFLEDGDLGLGGDALVRAEELDFVAGEADMIARGHHVEGGVGRRPEAVGPQVTDIEVGAIVVG